MSEERKGRKAAFKESEKTEVRGGQHDGSNSQAEQTAE